LHAGGQCGLDGIEAGVDTAGGVGVGRAEFESGLGGEADRGSTVVGWGRVGSERHSVDGGEQELVEAFERAVIRSG
jgi:hypothetical protein